MEQINMSSRETIEFAAAIATLLFAMAGLVHVLRAGRWGVRLLFLTLLLSLAALFFVDFMAAGTNWKAWLLARIQLEQLQCIFDSFINTVREWFGE